MEPGLDDIGGFLAALLGPVSGPTVLQAGAWSSAYAFEADGRELVLRLGHHREDFDKERVAGTWNEPGLPVPEVLEVGEVFDRYYIVSQRHHGTKLADLDPATVPRVVEGLIDVLAATRRVALPGSGYGIWLAPAGDAPAPSWSEHLCAVADRDERRLVGWRGRLAAHSRALDAFWRGCTALRANADRFPHTRAVVHADLLLNHLVGPDGDITAVFDWGNSLAGDPLYDIAWIVYCIPWFPAIDRRHVLGLARSRFPDDDVDGLVPWYELHIAVASLQYQAYIEDDAELERTVDRVDHLLTITARR
jgi:hygromycin-B 4-O-kinase